MYAVAFISLALVISFYTLKKIDCASIEHELAQSYGENYLYQPEDYFHQSSADTRWVLRDDEPKNEMEKKKKTNPKAKASESPGVEGAEKRGEAVAGETKQTKKPSGPKKKGAKNTAEKESSEAQPGNDGESVEATPDSKPQDGSASPASDTYSSSPAPETASASPRVQDTGTPPSSELKSVTPSSGLNSVNLKPKTKVVKRKVKTAQQTPEANPPQPANDVASTEGAVVGPEPQAATDSQPGEDGGDEKKKKKKHKDKDGDDDDEKKKKKKKDKDGDDDDDDHEKKKKKKDKDGDDEKKKKQKEEKEEKGKKKKLKKVKFENEADSSEPSAEIGGINDVPSGDTTTPDEPVTVPDSEFVSSSEHGEPDNVETEVYEPSGPATYTEIPYETAVAEEPPPPQDEEDYGQPASPLSRFEFQQPPAHVEPFVQHPPPPPQPQPQHQHQPQPQPQPQHQPQNHPQYRPGLRFMQGGFSNPTHLSQAQLAHIMQDARRPNYGLGSPQPNRWVRPADYSPDYPPYGGAYSRSPPPPPPVKPYYSQPGYGDGYGYGRRSAWVDPDPLPVRRAPPPKYEPAYDTYDVPRNSPVAGLTFDEYNDVTANFLAQRPKMGQLIGYAPSDYAAAYRYAEDYAHQRRRGHPVWA